MNDHVLVTGGSGFVGKHVLSALLSEQKCRVTVVGRNREKFGPLLDQYQNLEFVEFDISHANDGVFNQLGKPDAVLHLAWDQLPNYLNNYHYEVELPRQYAFLKRLVAGGVRNLVVTGTCFEYGMRNGSLDEEMACTPTNPYGFAKYSLLSQLNFLKSEHPFNLCWARLFYSYGDGQSAKSLYSQLCGAVKRGDVSFNLSPGQQLRDFLPIQTVAKYLVGMCNSQKDLGIVNICSGQPVSVQSFVKEIAEQLDSHIKFNLGYYPYAEYEPLAFWGNPAKLQSLSLT
jgi:nucleoside-diphosphate-sugar epimerase